MFKERDVCELLTLDTIHGYTRSTDPPQSNIIGLLKKGIHQGFVTS